MLDVGMNTFDRRSVEKVVKIFAHRWIAKVISETRLWLFHEALSIFSKFLNILISLVILTFLIYFKGLSYEFKKLLNNPDFNGIH